jgi:WG containing repeat
MSGATATMKRTARRVTLAVLIVSVAAGSEIFGQNAQPNVNQESSQDLTPIQRNGKWGYADRSGKVVIGTQFSRADRFSEGLALVWTGGAPLTDPVATAFVKMGYINTTGRWVIHSRFGYYFFDDFSEGLVPFRKQFGKWGYMDRIGKIVIRPRFDWAGNFSGGTAPALLDGKCAHLDKTGRVTDQSQTATPRQKNEQDSHGTYQFKPHAPPCS